MRLCVAAEVDLNVLIGSANSGDGVNTPWRSPRPGCKVGPLTTRTRTMQSFWRSGGLSGRRYEFANFRITPVRIVLTADKFLQAMRACGWSPSAGLTAGDPPGSGLAGCTGWTGCTGWIRTEGGVTGIPGTGGAIPGWRGSGATGKPGHVILLP